MTYHIIPLGEKDLHEDNTECVCKPHVSIEREHIFIRHWSLLIPEKEEEEWSGVVSLDLSKSKN
jgi:hypothetical protein